MFLILFKALGHEFEHTHQSSGAKSSAPEQIGAPEHEYEHLHLLTGAKNTRGGWLFSEYTALRRVSLVWMVREAQRTGFHFDKMKLHALNRGYPESITASSKRFLLQYQPPRLISPH
jgi:hypothetical protein